MPQWLRLLAALLTAALAGCATQPRRHAHVADWEGDELASAPNAPSSAQPTLLAQPSAQPAAVASPAPAPTAQSQAASNAPVRERAGQDSPSHGAPPARGKREDAATPGFAAPSEMWVALNRWCKANGWSAPCRIAAAPLPAFSLSSSNGVFVLRTGSRLAQWDGLDLGLGFAPQLINGLPFVHALDLQKTIVPLVAGPQMDYLQTNGLIVIDPGHGGENAGAKSVLGNHYEKEFTLDWALRLEPLLVSNGWQVLLTRTTDCDVALSNRVAFAQRHQASLFLSLHFNSAGTETDEAGLETYCLTPPGLPSSLTRGYADDPSVRFPNNAFDAQNLQLAVRVHRELLRVNDQRDRGVRRARFPGVLRGQLRPAILIEGGYLSSPREARRIADPAYRQKLAEAVARALGGETKVHHPPSEALRRTGSLNTKVGEGESAVGSPQSTVHSPQPTLQTPQPTTQAP